MIYQFRKYLKNLGPLYFPALGPGLGPQFVLTGLGPQFVFTGPGPQFALTDSGSQFVFTGPGPSFSLLTLTATLDLPALVSKVYLPAPALAMTRSLYLPV